MSSRDQDFLVGDHGWFDKRLTYEESLAMPFLVRCSATVAAGSVCRAMALNVDVELTFLELAGVEVPDVMQGRSHMPLLRGEVPDDWRRSMYDCSWIRRDGADNVPAHSGVRTRTRELTCSCNDPLGQDGSNGPIDLVEWELFDLVADHLETTNVIRGQRYADVRTEFEAERARLQAEAGDEPYPAVLRRRWTTRT